jgi:hypothetical protein
LFLDIAIGQTSRPAQSAPASRAFEEHPERFLDHNVIERLREAIAVSDEQVLAMHRLVDAYLREARAIQAASHQLLFGAGGDRMMEIDRLVAAGKASHEDKIAVVEEVGAALAEIEAQLARDLDALLHRTLAEMASSVGLDEDATQHLWRLVRRKYFFDIKRTGDFTTRIDLIALARDASQEGDELFVIANATGQSELRALHDALEAALLQYEERLQACVAPMMRDELQPQKGPYVMRFTSNDYELWKEHSEKQAAEWRAKQGFLIAAHKQIGDLIAACGNLDEQRRWEDRLLRAMCPHLMGDFMPDRLDEWVARHVTKDEEALVKIKTIVAEYQQKKPSLQREAALAGIQAHLDGQQGVASTAAGKRYARALIALHELGIETIRESIEALPGDAREKMLRRLALEGALDTGPFVPMFMGPATGMSAKIAAIDNPWR